MIKEKKVLSTQDISFEYYLDCLPFHKHLMNEPLSQKERDQAEKDISRVSTGSDFSVEDIRRYFDQESNQKA